MDSTPDPYDDWFQEKHGSSDDIELESDVDDCIEDDYSDDPENRLDWRFV